MAEIKTTTIPKGPKRLFITIRSGFKDKKAQRQTCEKFPNMRFTTSGNSMYTEVKEEAQISGRINELRQAYVFYNQIKIG